MVNKNGRDEARARVRQGKTARREGVAIEKEPGQRERIGEIGVGCRLTLTQEAGEPQEFFPVFFACRARDRTARARRHVDEIIGRAGRGAGRKIKAEAELGEEGKLEARDHGGDRRGIVQSIEDRLERAMDARMRLALGKQTAQRREMRDAVDGMRRRENTGRAQIDALDQVMAEMLVEPRPPCCAQRIAGLQHAAQPRAGATAHQAEMAAAR